MVVGPITFSNNNNIHPLLSGLTQALQNKQTAIQNQYLPQSLQAKIQESLANAAYKNKQTQWYDPTQMADNEYKKALTGYYSGITEPEAELKSAQAKQAQALIQAAQAYLQQTGGGNEQAPSGDTGTAGQGEGGGGGGGNLQQAISNQLSPQQQPQVDPLERLSNANAIIRGQVAPGAQVGFNTREAQNKAEISSYNQYQKELASNANQAIQVKNLADEFEENYKKAAWTGPVEGSMNVSRVSIPTTVSTLGGSDLKHDQLADLAAANMQAQMSSLLKGAQLRGPELAFLSRLKLNRSLEPGAVKTQANMIRATADRTLAEQEFSGLMHNAGVSTQTIKQLWSQYSASHPLLNFKTGKPNPESWKEYFNAGGQQASSQQQKSKYTDEDIAHTAKENGMTVEQVKAELKKRGIL